MAPNIDIDLLLQKLSDPACPVLVTDAEIATNQMIIETCYPSLASRVNSIRPHSTWLEKSRCNTETAHYSRQLFESYGFKDDKCLVSFLTFLAGIHDLGHLQWLINEHGGAIEDLSTHGQLSFDTLKEWGVKFANPRAREIANFVLTHHTDKNPIPTSNTANSFYRLACLYISVIRDAEILAGKEAQNN